MYLTAMEYKGEPIPRLAPELIAEYCELTKITGKYKCLICGYEEQVGGKFDDGPVVVHSRVLDVKATFSCSRVKAIAEAEIKHVWHEHLRSRNTTRGENARPEVPA